MRAFRGKNNFGGCHYKVIFWLLKNAGGFKQGFCLHLNQINRERNQRDQSWAPGLKVEKKKKSPQNLDIHLRFRKDWEEFSIIVNVT